MSIILNIIYITRKTEHYKVTSFFFSHTILGKNKKDDLTFMIRLEQVAERLHILCKTLYIVTMM